MYTVDNPIFEAVYKAVNKSTSDTIDVLAALVDLKANDKLDLAESYLVAKNFDPNYENRAEQLDRLKKNDERREIDRVRNEKVADWVLKNVDSGMIVKVSGTRDKGYRQVIKMYSDSAGIYLECRQLEVFVPVGCRRPKAPKYDQLKDRPYITSHLLKKVTAILINDEWKKVTDLIKEEDDG